MTFDIDARRVGITDPDSMDLAEAKLRDAMTELETLRARSATLLYICNLSADIFLELKHGFVASGDQRGAEVMGIAEDFIRKSVVAP
jgi:hypothetical protein